MVDLHYKQELEVESEYLEKSSMISKYHDFRGVAALPGATAGSSHEAFLDFAA